MLRLAYVVRHSMRYNHNDARLHDGNVRNRERTVSDNRMDGTAGAPADVAGLNSGEDGGAISDDTAPDQETADVAVADDAGQVHAIPRNPTKAVDEETSIGETSGHASRIVGG